MLVRCSQRCADWWNSDAGEVSCWWVKKDPEARLIAMDPRHQSLRNILHLHSKHQRWRMAYSTPPQASKVCHGTVFNRDVVTHTAVTSVILEKRDRLCASTYPSEAEADPNVWRRSVCDALQLIFNGDVSFDPQVSNQDQYAASWRYLLVLFPVGWHPASHTKRTSAVTKHIGWQHPRHMKWWSEI